MTNVERERVETLAARWSLESLRTLASSGALLGDEPAAPGPVALRIQVGVTVSSADGSASFVLDFRVEALAPAPRPAFFVATSKLALRYRVPSRPAPAELEAFARTQVLAHAWAHLRSLVLVQGGLAGIRPLVLPGLRLNESGATLQAAGHPDAPLVAAIQHG